MHTSKPNRSNDRRIGLNIQYIAPHVRQLKTDQDSAILVRGVDNYQHFQNDIPSKKPFDEAAWGRQQALTAKLTAIQGDAS